MADLFRRRGRTRAQVSGWQQPAAAVPLEDMTAAAELAREAASPFGYKRPAGEVLARFGGDTAEARRRATAALAVSGVAAEPPLAAVQASQFVRLRRAEVDPAALQPLAEPARPARPAAPQRARPAAPPPAVPPSAAAPVEPAQEPEELMPRRPSWAMRVAARNAPRGRISREGRFRAGALGLVALFVLLVAVVLLRGAIGSPGGDRGGDLAPAATEAAVETTARETTPAAPPATTPRTTATAPSATARRTASEPATPPRVTPAPATPPAAPARPRAVTLRIVPSESSYLCVADGAGRTLWEGMRTGPYEVRGRRLIMRVGVATMKVTVDGRALPINSAPSAYLLTARGVTGLPDDRPVCGAA